MHDTGWPSYLLSCGLLLVPILAWNVAFTRFLPPALGTSEFRREIPPFIAYGENGLRLAIMVLPFLMPLELATAAARRGLLVFGIGALVYFSAWVPLMIAPQAAWSESRLGFLAPAYTPLLWLGGIGLAGRRIYGSPPYRPWVYVALAAGFVAFHVAHAHLVYTRTHRPGR